MLLLKLAASQQGTTLTAESLSPHPILYLLHGMDGLQYSSIFRKICLTPKIKRDVSIVCGPCSACYFPKESHLDSTTGFNRNSKGKIKRQAIH